MSMTNTNPASRTGLLAALPGGFRAGLRHWRVIVGGLSPMSLLIPRTRLYIMTKPMMKNGRPMTVMTS